MDATETKGDAPPSTAWSLRIRRYQGLVLAIAAPYLAWRYALGEPTLELAIDVLLPLFAAFAAAIPLTLVLEATYRALATRSLPRLWVGAPSATSSYRSKPIGSYRRNADEEAVQDAVERRVGAAGFLFEQKEAGQLRFHKSVDNPCVEFMDHAFDGTVSIEEQGGSTAIDVRITMDDTLIYDTGEGARLQAVADRIAGNPTRPAPPPVTLMTLAGFDLVYAATVVGLVGSADFSRWVLPALGGGVVLLLCAVELDKAQLRQPASKFSVALACWVAIVPALGAAWAAIT